MSDTTGEPMRVIYLQAENVKRLKAVRIKPDKTLVRIEGRNAQGKSSVLDAIAAALGGGKRQPDMPVRRGEKKASVRLDLGSLIVERRWTAAGGTMLEVTTPDGTRQATPQAILDKLVSDLTFDPLEFVNMKPKDQAVVLKRAAGLDFTELDDKRDQLFAVRTLANRDAKAADAGVGDMPMAPSSKTPIDIRSLADKQQNAIEHNRHIDNLEESAERSESNVSECQSNLREAERRLTIAKGIAEEIHSKVAGMKRKDVGDLGAAIAEAERTNAAIKAREAYEQRYAQAKEKQDEADSLTKQIEAIDAEKHRRLQGAKFPLDGLSIDENGPTLNGIPFSQASSSEQLRTGVAIGLSEKKQARIMLVHDGSLLDSENLVELHKIAEEFDAQIFVERVADAASKSAVYIEDGEVVEHTQ